MKRLQNIIMFSWLFLFRRHLTIVITGVILVLIDNVLSVYASKGITVRENNNMRHVVDFLFIDGWHRFKGDFAKVSITSTESEWAHAVNQRVSLLWGLKKIEGITNIQTISPEAIGKCRNMRMFWRNAIRIWMGWRGGRERGWNMPCTILQCSYEI